MSFRPNMTATINGVRVYRPLQWRAFGGVVADLWHAEGTAGGGGYYLSPDPRIVIFLDEIGPHMRFADSPQALSAASPPSQIMYVPAGMPLWSRLAQNCRFSHVDLHFDIRLLEQRLSKSFGPAALSEALRQPAVQTDHDTIVPLAQLLANEIARPAHHDLFGEGLIQSILSTLLVCASEKTSQGGLTPMQIRRLHEHLAANPGRRFATAELAEVAGLSESWFAHAFKQATGETPLRWQIRLRIEQAQKALGDPALTLADVASLTGFADQAHLTRAFRSQIGCAPGAWRRSQAVG